MRILYFAHYTGGMDAASAMDADLFRELRAQGNEVVVLAPFARPDAARAGGSVSTGRLPRLFLSFLGYARMTLAGLRALRNDPKTAIVSQYHAFHPATVVAFLVARLRGRPLLARAHDPLPGSYRGTLDALINRALFRGYRRILSRDSVWLTVPSPELRDVVTSRLGLPAKRVVVVPNNVTPFEAVEPGVRDRLRTSLGLSNRRVVLQFGSFTMTGAKTYVEALRLLNRADVVGLVLADPSRGTEFAREASNRGANDRVRVLGLRRRDELSAFVDLADACVGLLSADPTAYGSLPRNTLEAMAVGKPVIVCSGAVSATLLENGRNALVIPPDDPNALSRAIARILENPALSASLGNRARETIRERFHSAEVARTFGAVLETVASAPRS